MSKISGASKKPKSNSTAGKYQNEDDDLQKNQNQNKNNLQQSLGKSQNPNANSNQNNNNNNNLNEFDDDLSNISFSEVDENENDDEHINEIDAVNYQIDDMITKLRKYFDENSDTILPSDPTKLRSLLESLTNQVKSISETYSQNLQSMSSINKRLKFQAKDYYDRYKELKKTFDKERKEFQTKKKVIQCEEKLNQDENEKIKNEINEVKNELDFFQKKLGIFKNEEDSNKDNKDDETEIMIDILKSLKEKNVDIYEGLTKDQIDFINEVINDEVGNSNNNQNNNSNNDDSIEGEKYAKAIEDVANKIYNMNLIPDIDIKQIETNIYSFNDKEVELQFDENDKLKLNNGMDLETWIIETFKIPSANDKGNNNVNNSSKEKMNAVNNAINAKGGNKKKGTGKGHKK